MKRLWQNIVYGYKVLLYEWNKLSTRSRLCIIITGILLIIVLLIRCLFFSSKFSLF